MDWPLLTSVAAPRVGDELDRKTPVGTVVGCKVCLVAKGMKTKGDYAVS